MRCSSLTVSQKPGSNARAKIPISDGDVSVLAILSDTAWDAYDKGLEEGEEARKGDLLLCKKLTVVSTTYGPSEERIKLRIEDLELTGNFRRVIGQPSPLLERPSITTLREKIEDLRMKQLQSEVPAEDDQEDVSAEEDEEMENDPEDEEGVKDDDQTGDDAARVPANAPHEPAPADVALPEKLPNIVSRMSPPNRTSPALHNTASTQLESQLPLDVTPTQAIPPPRNPVRRTRGGFSIGREGFEPTRGDNLTGPQAPTLHARHSRLSESPQRPQKPKLLDVLSKLPGQVPKKRSPEPSAPVSAQVVNEDVVVETPHKAKRSPAASSAHDELTPIARKRYRIPRDQKALLEHPSSWIPSAPGHEFPHPNVPINILTAWNAKAKGAAKAPLQSSPIPEIEQSSEVKSLEAVQAEPQATAAAEFEDESDGSEDSDSSDDRPISDWSVSPSRSQALPPDSSAGHISPRVSRPVSRDTAISGSERMPISIADDVASISSAGNKSIAGSSNRYGELPQWKQSAASQGLPAGERVSSTPITNKTPRSTYAGQKQSPRAPNTTQRPTGDNVRPNPEQTYVPSSSLRSPALPVASQSPATPLGPSDQLTGGATARPVGHSDRRQPTAASQPMSAGMKRPQPLADNHYGPVRASTQQKPEYRRRTVDSMEHVPASKSPTTPFNPPSGPRAFTGPRSSTYDRRNPNPLPSEPRKDPRPTRGSQYGASDRRSNGSTSERERAPSGYSYRPSPSEPRCDPISSVGGDTDKRSPGGTQTPNSTNEMESAVPRALPTTNYRQERSQFYRNEQQRQW